MLSVLLATVTLHWTNPGLARFAIPCADSTVLANLTQANLYWAPVGSDGTMQLLRSHVYLTGTPLTDSVEVPDTPATYWVIPQNAAGESQCPPRGYTVGVPSVGVGTTPQMERRPLYDIAGRRIHPPYASGVFFTKDRHIVIIK